MKAPKPIELPCLKCGHHNEYYDAYDPQQDPVELKFSNQLCFGCATSMFDEIRYLAPQLARCLRFT
jgi:hypothetical protein